MGHIRINNHGLFTTIQDLGRVGYQQFGMPVSGAMDTYSMKLANWLVGNSPGEACLEAAFMGPEIEFQSDSLIAVCGGDAPVTINNKTVDMFRSLPVKAGDVLSFGMMNNGCRLYIAFSGGIDVHEVMGSKSTYLRAKVGGFNGRGIMTGDKIKIGNPVDNKSRVVPLDYLMPIKKEQQIRIIPGTEISRFSFEGITSFLNSEFTISPQSDRMGYRLSGPKIEHKDGADIISSGIANGAVQVPGHGEPIIMLADRQTVGGYTKIANVITVDLPLLGQMKAGDKIRFKEVGLDEAQRLLREQERRLGELNEVAN